MSISTKDSTRVLLIFPTLAEKNPSPPLGMGYIAGVLEKYGCDVRIIDAAAISSDITEEDILRSAREFKPHIIGIHLIIMNIVSGYRLAKKLNVLEALLVAGGPHASVLPREPLENGFDISVRGEAELTIVDLVRYINGDKKLDDIQGISYRLKGALVENVSRAPNMNLDSLPIPAFHLFNKDHYRTGSRLYQFAGSLVATRGCPFQCSFCFKGVFGNSVKLRSAENIVDEIQYVHDTYGVRFINFIDELFTVNRHRLEKFCDLLIERGLAIEWMANSRVDSIDPSLLTKMKKAGCHMIHFGVESVDPASIDHLHKKIDHEKIVSALMWTKDAGIRTQVYIMCGFPWETPETGEQNIMFLEKNDYLIDEILNRAFLVPFPGTEVYERYHEQYRFSQWWLERWYVESFSLGDYIPLHNRVFFHDYRLQQRPLFKYSFRTKWKIRKLVSLIGRKHLKVILPNIYASRTKRSVYLLILKISSFSHRVNLRFGRTIMNLLYRMVCLISPGKAQYLR